MPTVFKPAVDVSPLIRFGRWSFLLAGIAYGAFWQSRYEKYELSVKDVKLREKAERDARIAHEKQMAAAREIQELEKMGRGGN
ncbi:ATP synthase subunit e, mitochondrial [Macrosteles quadrilineatus]|uniref:ATP synthase subunit e, mitochondrial n=1 Tax=Macrosteles quadrilineatus TaxID=74068 RepID=UPI0023E0B988|nr:ATP synthase subunit e, mitochondrial [Macrosteles quadrilineatus]